jgi:hypothetical protein
LARFAQVIARINPTMVMSTYSGLEYSLRKESNLAPPGSSESSGSTSAFFGEAAVPAAKQWNCVLRAA